MRTIHLIAASVLALLGTAAGAQEIVREPVVPTTSVVTRAQVQAEVVKAIHDGTLATYGEGDNSAPSHDAFVSTRSRDDVKAEARQAFGAYKAKSFAERANG